MDPQAINVSFLIVFALLLFGIIALTGSIWRNLANYDRVLRPHRSTIRIAVSGKSTCSVSESELNDLDGMLRRISRQFTWLGFLSTVPPMFGILGTLLAIYNSNLDDVASLSSSFRLALSTTIIGLVVAIIGKACESVFESTFRHEQKDFDVLRSLAPDRAACPPEAGK